MRVRIFKTSKNVMQSGRAKDGWRLEAELETARVPEAIMGWASSGDTLNEIRMNFTTREAAERFAVKQGWEIVPETQAQERVIVPRNYSDTIFKARRRGV